MIRLLTILASVLFISVTFVSSAELVNATGSELRRVNDPARDHGLNLGFAEVSGAFLGDVTVVIEDRSGKELVNTVVDGPWFFVPLPAGTYHVKAIFDEQVKHIKDLRLAETQVTMMVVYWDLNVPATQMLASAGHAASS
jgi:hypothetical protein